MKDRITNFIEIDGSYGEGGGQILRTALSFSAILGIPIRVHHIRAGRKNPGLQSQHLRGVEALARMTRARTEGVRIGSRSILFSPRKILPGQYRFEVGTAGSVSLLLQGLLPPLCLSREGSKLTLVGGTHVPWSPPFHYLSEILFPTLKKMEISVNATIERWGWYPRGGGMIHVEILPSRFVKSVSFVEKGPLRRIRGLSATSHLPDHVGERQRDYALKKIREELGLEAEISLLRDAPAYGPGSFIFLVAECDGAVAGFSTLGERGKRAEDVAEEAVDSLRAYVRAEGCIDPHLADQLVPFMALGRGTSSFTTTRMTGHLLTNLWVIEHLGVSKISTWVREGGPGKVEFISEQRSF